VPLAALGRRNIALIEFGRSLVRRHLSKLGEDRAQLFGAPISVVVIGDRLCIGATQLDART